MAHPTFPVYFENYLKLVSETDAVAAFNRQQSLINEYFDTIPEASANLAYAEGKWTLKEMLQHLIDTERIMAYRALCFARGEQAPLPGFDENAYATNSFAADREWKPMINELKKVRLSNLQMFQTFNPGIIDNVGSANGKEVTPRLMGLIMVGHIYHHRNIIEERYKPLFKV